MIIALDIGGTAIKVGQFNAQRELVHFQVHPHDGRLGGASLVQKVSTIIQGYSDFRAICISTSGQVNSETGTIIFANDNIPGYTNTNLKQRFEQQFHVPVYVENDVNCAALGENYFGAGKAYDDFICVTYGTGIGGAIILQNTLYKGANGIAGEFGHLLTHYDGLPCNCGRKGCYESYASTTALIKAAMQLDSSYHNGIKVFELYEKNQANIVSLVNHWINEIAIGLVSIIHIFNPPAIVIGGGIMEQQLLVNHVATRVNELIMESFSSVKIIKAELGNKAGIYGALSLLPKDVFQHSID